MSRLPTHLPKIIAFLNQKGGVGKTTLATNVAGFLSLQKKRILYIDVDPQGSALDWHSFRQKEPLFNIIGLPRPIVHKSIASLSEGYDYVILDSPPRQDALAKSVIVAAGLIIIPVQPSPYDIWAAQETVDLIKEASSFKETQKSAFVINRKISNTAIGRDIKETLLQHEIPVLETQIGQRVVFAESANQGLVVHELSPKSAAASEVEGLVEEIVKIYA
jgi:chromosome partitioning protein